jgi:hypothetical protein
MRWQRLLLTFVLLLFGTSCAGGEPATPQAPTVAPTMPPPTRTPMPTATSTATLLPPSPTATATPVPQPVLLRRRCGRDYVVRVGEPIELFYGGWGVLGDDLAQQWATAFSADLTIDGEPVEGRQQPPSPELPLNCQAGPADIRWLYYRAVLPGLSAGRHDVTVTFNALRGLTDGYGPVYGPGQMARQTFRLTAE